MIGIYKITGRDLKIFAEVFEVFHLLKNYPCTNLL